MLLESLSVAVVLSFFWGVFALGKAKLQRSAMFIATTVQLATSPSGAAMDPGPAHAAPLGLENFESSVLL